MFSTISGRLTAILMSFAVLLGVGALASHMVLKRQSDDALIVNLAGRERMLTQKMAKEVAQLVNLAHDGNEELVASQREQLQGTVRVFETTLLALKDGGPAPLNLDMTRMRQTPAATNSQITRQLEGVIGLWDPFKKNVNAVLHSGGKDAAAARAIADANVPLMDQMNTVVASMQQESEDKVNVLFFVQGGALVAGLLLVGGGVWMARSSIARPLVELAQAARSMSKGNLNVELTADGARELRDLTDSFDRMRASMVAVLGGGLGGAAAATAIDDDL